MNSPENNVSDLPSSKLAAKNVISLRNIRSISKLNNCRSQILNQSISKKVLKPIKKQDPESTCHKRTISDTSSFLFTNGIIKDSSDTLHAHFIKKLKIFSDPEKKIIILLDFIEKLIKASNVYTEIFNSISETIKEYQKYVKNLDSTRIETSEAKIASENLNHNYNKNFENFSIKKLKTITREKNLSLDKSQNNTKLNSSGQQLHRENSISKFNMNNKKIFIPKLKVPLTQDKGYHQEFMEKYDEFSDSWQEAINKDNKKL